MDLVDLKPGAIIQGPVIPEPIQVVAVVPMGEATQIMGKGLTTGQFHDPILSKEQVALLTASPEKTPFDGDARRFRLDIEAQREWLGVGLRRRRQGVRGRGPGAGDGREGGAVAAATASPRRQGESGAVLKSES